MGQPCGGGDAGSCCGLGRCVDGVCARPPTSCAPDTRQWTHRTNFGGSGFGSSQLSVPRGLTVSRDGQAVWVTDADFNRISVWTASGSGWVHQLNFGSRGNGPGQFLNALGMAVSGDGQTAWVADTDNHRISVWVRSGNTWAQQTTFGSLGSDPNRFNTPAGVAVSPDGQIAWVADSRNHRISVWTKAGSGWTNLTTFGSKGSPSGQFDLPSGVAVSADGQTVWVADLGNDRVSVWEKSGSAWAPQATFGSRGSGSTQFRGLTEVAVSPDGQTAWVADRGNARVSVWALACPPA
jgi:DNA-binding beta-propeller fold protein YncE